jgi:hypothetical protein
MVKVETDQVSISKYAERILLLQLKYMDIDFTDSVRILPLDVFSIEKKCHSKSYKGQTVEQYLNEVERNIKHWCL